MATYNNTYFEYFFDEELIKGYLNTLSDIIGDEEGGDTFQFTSDNPTFIKYTGTGTLTIPHTYIGDDMEEHNRFIETFLEALAEFEENNGLLE